jgi:hypothetical protein
MYSMNLPGPDWAQSFIKQHSEIRKRVANDIIRSKRRGGRVAKIPAGTRVVYTTMSQDEAEVSGQSTFDPHPSTSKDLSAYHAV